MGIMLTILGMAIFGGSVTIGDDNQNITCSTPGIVGRWRTIQERSRQQRPS